MSIKVGYAMSMLLKISQSYCWHLYFLFIESSIDVWLLRLSTIVPTIPTIIVTIVIGIIIIGFSIIIIVKSQIIRLDKT